MTFDSTAWQRADINSDDNATAPDPGTYEVKVTDGRAFTSKAGNTVLIVELEVLTGPAAGHRWPEVRGFKSDGQVKAAKSMCARLGIEVGEITSLDALDTAVKAVIGSYFGVDVVQNGDYRNVFVGDRLTATVPTDVPFNEGEFETAPVTDDDVPF